MTARGTWKGFERRVAGILGGKRHPVTGERAAADVESDILVIQCKKGYRFPAYLLGWLSGITTWRGQAAPNKYAAVVWQEKGRRDADALVVIRLEEFAKLAGRADAR